MSAKSILEADGKAILNYHLTRAPVIKPTPLPPSATHNAPSRLASLHFPANEDVKNVLDQAEVKYPWLLQSGSKFVAKPDQLIKRRGKAGLLCLNKSWSECREWIQGRAGKSQRVETVDGILRQFLVEPFVPHAQDTEYYINIHSVRDVSIYISFHFTGSVVLPGNASKMQQTRSRNLGCVAAKSRNNFSGSSIPAIFMLVILASSATRFEQRNIRGLASGERRSKPCAINSLFAMFSHALFSARQARPDEGNSTWTHRNISRLISPIPIACKERFPASVRWFRDHVFCQDLAFAASSHTTLPLSFGC